MRAYTRAEAVQLAFEDAYNAARKNRRLRPYFTKAKKLKKLPGWVPWWERPHHGTRHIGGDL